MMTQGQVKIERGVPFPKTKRRIYPFMEMKIGDSFLVPPRKKNSVTVLAFKYSNGKTKFTVRAVEGGYRCWRIV